MCAFFRPFVPNSMCVRPLDLVAMPAPKFLLCLCHISPFSYPVLSLCAISFGFSCFFTKVHTTHTCFFFVVSLSAHLFQSIHSATSQKVCHISSFVVSNARSQWTSNFACVGCLSFLSCMSISFESWLSAKIGTN